MPSRDSLALENAARALSNLEHPRNDSLDKDSTEVPDRFHEFQLASAGTTQRIRSRRVRFKMLYKALAGINIRVHKRPLSHLYDLYFRRSLSLTSRFLTERKNYRGSRRLCEPIHRDGQAYLVVKLQHLWGEFCRELVVRSAIGGCETRTGQTLPRVPGRKYIREITSVVPELSSGTRTYWENPAFVIKHARRLQVANHNQISLGIGSVSNSLTDLKCVRNFIVHPNRSTRGKYYQLTRSIGFSGLTPDRLLHQYLPGGVTVFDDWISKLTAAAWNAVA